MPKNDHVTGDESGRRGDDAPGEQDARDPAPGAHLGQDQIAGDFEQEIADEEDAAADAEDFG